MSTSVEDGIPIELHAQFDARCEALEAEFAPDSCNTIGQFAVQGDLARAVILVDAEPWLDYELPPAETSMTHYLQEVRNRLAEVEPKQLSRVSFDLVQTKVPEFLMNILGVEYSHLAIERLAQANPDGTPAVADDALLNFLQWHSWQVAANRQRFMDQEWPWHKREYVRNLKQATREGWMPEAVLKPERIETLEHINITMDDGLLLHENGASAFTSTHRNGSSKEVFLPQYSFPKTIAHELTHVMVGVELPGKNDQGRFGDDVIHHGLYRLFDKDHKNAGQALNEAVTEHVALNMGYYGSDIQTVDPESQRHLLSSYRPERELLNVLCNGGKKPVDIKLFINAYFEDSTSRRQTAQRKLKRQLARAFPGRNVLTELGNLMADAEYDEATEAIPGFVRSLL